MNKKLFVILFFLSFAGLSLFITHKTALGGDPLSPLGVGNMENCPNFNGKMFLLTGGSGKPQNTEHLKYELARLSWLCDGGKIS